MTRGTFPYYYGLERGLYLSRLQLDPVYLSEECMIQNALLPAGCATEPFITVLGQKLQTNKININIYLN